MCEFNWFSLLNLFMRPSHISAVLEREFAGSTSVQAPVMLWGPPGIGKSQLVRAVAQRHSVNLIDVRLSGPVTALDEGRSYTVEAPSERSKSRTGPSMRPGTSVQPE